MGAWRVDFRCTNVFGEHSRAQLQQLTPDFRTTVLLIQMIYTQPDLARNDFIEIEASLTL